MLLFEANEGGLNLSAVLTALGCSFSPREAGGEEGGTGLHEVRGRVPGVPGQEV